MATAVPGNVAGTGAVVGTILAAISPTLIVILLFSCMFLASVLVVAALALSSQISREEGVDERPYQPDTSTEQLTRFPRSR